MEKLDMASVCWRRRLVVEPPLEVNLSLLLRRNLVKEALAQVDVTGSLASRALVCDYARRLDSVPHDGDLLAAIGAVGVHGRVEGDEVGPV